MLRRQVILAASSVGEVVLHCRCGHRLRLWRGVGLWRYAAMLKLWLHDFGATCGVATRVLPSCEAWGARLCLFCRYLRRVHRDGKLTPRTRMPAPVCGTSKPFPDAAHKETL